MSYHGQANDNDELYETAAAARRCALQAVLLCVLILSSIEGSSNLALAFSFPSISSRHINSKSINRRIDTSLHVSTSISTATGEADRAFRLGIQLEKAGLARAASAAFHEAATLYQCFLDQSTLATDANADADATATDGDTNGNLSSSTNSNPTNIFQHVTSLAYNTDDGVSVLAVLAYACIRLGHLSHDAFGDSRAAKRLYKLAASIDPLPVEWHITV